MNGACEPVQKPTLTGWRGCLALTKSGAPCRAIGGAGGYCIAHRAGQPHMAKIGRKGGRSLGFNLE
jgi:hypothetical protein